MFCKLDIHGKSIVTVALRYFVNRVQGLDVGLQTLVPTFRFWSRDKVFVSRFEEKFDNNIYAANSYRPTYYY